MATVLIARHGRTTANSSGTLAGWTPGVGLDERGREQATVLGERLVDLPIVRVVASPLQRCQETAALLVPSAQIESDDDLGECRYGGWTGQKINDLAKDPLWRVVQDHPSAAVFPPGDFPHESIAAMQTRAVAAIRRIDAEVEREHGPRAIWLAVSHGDVIKAIVTDAMGAHLDTFQRIVVAPASLSAVRYTTRRPFVLRVNDNGTPVADLVPAPEQSDDATPGGDTGRRDVSGEQPSA